MVAGVIVVLCICGWLIVCKGMYVLLDSSVYATNKYMCIYIYIDRLRKTIDAAIPTYF